jgi:hypothetical protein
MMDTTKQQEATPDEEDLPPTQVLSPRRTSWRTFFQAAVGALPVANGVLLTVQGFLSEQSIRSSISPWIFALVNVSVIVGAYLAKLVAQLMAHPSINRWIEANASPLAPMPRPEK